MPKRMLPVKWLGILVAFWCLSFSPVQAQEDHDDLEYPLQQLAAATKEIMRQRGVKTIAVGDFRGPPALATAAGSGIKLRLQQELRRLDVRRRTIGAPLSISGTFRVGDHGQGQFATKACYVDAKFHDAEGNLLVSLNQPVKYQRTLGTGNETFKVSETVPMSRGVITLTIRRGGTMAALLGTTIAEQKSPRRDEPWLAGIMPEKVVDSFQRPTAVLANQQSAVRASANSPFLVEILIDGEPRRMTLIDGHPFVPLHKGETFQVRVTNRAPYTASCRLTLDGVNNFAFSEVLQTKGERKGLHKYQRWILASGKSYPIVGWHINNRTVHEFKVTDFTESANAKVGGVAGIGTITAVFQATWILGREKPPVDEPMVAAAAEGIGFGERRGQNVREDTAPRFYGRDRSVITIRYRKPPAE